MAVTINEAEKAWERGLDLTVSAVVKKRPRRFIAQDSSASANRASADAGVVLIAKGVPSTN